MREDGREAWVRHCCPAEHQACFCPVWRRTTILSNIVIAQSDEPMTSPASGPSDSAMKCTSEMGSLLSPCTCVSVVGKMYSTRCQLSLSCTVLTWTPTPFW